MGTRSGRAIADLLVNETKSAKKGHRASVLLGSGRHPMPKFQTFPMPLTGKGLLFPVSNLGTRYEMLNAVSLYNFTKWASWFIFSKSGAWSPKHRKRA